MGQKLHKNKGTDHVGVSDRSAVSVRDCIAIARPNHWFKNIFMLPGAALALVLAPQVELAQFGRLAIAILSTCFVASANYTINEWLDAESDRHHAMKRHRPSADGRMRGSVVYTQWGLLAGLGLGVASYVGSGFFIISVVLLLMGIVYNVKPFRTKDRTYLDVLSESVNNPLRFSLGWFAIVGNVFPPASVLLAFWTGGAYLMTIKRYAEYRAIDDPAQAGRYRRSFKFYSEENLLKSAFFYGLACTFLLGVFLIKYKIELILSIPFICILFVWYLHIGMRPLSVAQNPEELYKENYFVGYVAFLSAFIIGLLFVDVPWLNFLVDFHAL